MIKKTLIIAPHPDDEINLAGQLIISLLKGNVEVFVAYTTNGDAEKKIGNKRIVEAINANAVFGIDVEHVIFLGYPNEWQGKTHIYNAKEGELLISKLGKTETNSIKEHPEFCFQRYGIHHKFTRENYKRDFKDLILMVFPDLMIVPEFDSHPDHRASSLMFDEVMGEILKEKSGYRPIIWKKYIHEGVWNGPKDYYIRPARPTISFGGREYAGQPHELESPAYHWDQRIRVGVDELTLTNLLKDNIIYKAAKQHKVTTAWYEMQRVINADAVYWKKRVDNEALTATFEVSSGEAKYLNDFKYYDSDDVCSKVDMLSNPSICCWQPELHDEKRVIVCRWEHKKRVKQIVIVEDCNSENHIKSLLIKTQQYSTKIEPNCDGSRTEISFPEAVTTDCIELQIESFYGKPGIAEVEIYSGIDADSLFKPYVENESGSMKDTVTAFQKLEMLLLKVKFLFTFKAKYEVEKLFSIIRR